MNVFLFVAALLTSILGTLHSWIGDKFLMSRLHDLQGLPQILGGDDFTKKTIRFAWHLTSIAWFGMSAILVCLAFGTSTIWIIRTIAVTFWLSGIIAFVGSQGRHISWIIFLIITVMAWLGS